MGERKWDREIRLVLRSNGQWSIIGPREAETHSWFTIGEPLRERMIECETARGKFLTRLVEAHEAGEIHLASDAD